MRKVTITYDRLSQSSAALDVMGKLSKGMKGGDKLLIGKTLRALSGDRQDLEEMRSDLASKYAEIGFQRQKDEIMARVADSDDAEAIAKAKITCEALQKPNGVLQNEMTDYQLEYSRNIEADVELSLPDTAIKVSALLKFDEFLPEHAAALDWLLEDDVSDDGDKVEPQRKNPWKKPDADAPAEKPSASEEVVAGQAKNHQDTGETADQQH